METTTEFLQYAAELLVDHPEEVSVTRQVDEKGVLLTLKVADSDMGKILGRGGAHAHAIRVLMRVIGSKSNERVAVRIHDPNPEKRFSHEKDS